MISLAFAGFLAGCAAVAAPIILHLLKKRPTETTPFPALRFLKPTIARKRNKNNIRRWIVLIARCLAITALCLAFSWPYLAEFAEHPDSATVFLWDNSFSVSSKNVAAAAKNKAMEIIGRASTKHPLLVGLVEENSVLWSGGFSGKSDKLAAFLAAEAKGEGASSFAEALKNADTRLAAIPATKKKIVVVTDKQAYPWRNFTNKPFLSPGVELEVEIPASLTKRNVAILSAETAAPFLRNRQEIVLNSRLKNFSDETWPTVCQLYLDGKLLETKKNILEPNADIYMKWKFNSGKLAPKQGKIVVRVSDDIDIDNTAYFALNPAKPPKVLILGKLPKNKTDFLAVAFAPDSKAKTADVEVRGHRDAADTLKSAKLVVLRNGVAPNSETGRKILDAVGKNNLDCVLLWNDSIETRAFLDKIGVSASYALERRSVNFGDLDLTHPLLACLENVKVGNLFNVWFKNHPSLKPPRGARIVAFFSDGTPAIFETRYGKGKILVVATALDREHTDWQISPFFLPFWREALARTFRRGGETATVGRPTTTPEGLKKTERFENGEWKTVAKANAARPRKAGIYRTLSKQGTRLFAVNVPPEESDPANIPDSFDWRSAVSKKNSAENIGTALSAIPPFSPEARKKSFWKILLIVAIAAACLELVVANRTAL